MGFFRYLFSPRAKAERNKQKEYLESLKEIVENVIQARKAKSAGSGQASNEIQENGQLENSAINQGEKAQEIERLEQAIIWVQKIKLDGLKAICLNFGESFKAMASQFEEQLKDDSGQEFLLELQKYQRNISSIPYYAKETVKEDINTQKEVIQQVKYICDQARDLSKKGKSLIEKFPKGSEERKTIINI